MTTMGPKAINNATGKRLLALIRDADYAHPGEEEANRLLFAGLAADPGRRILDAGCGGGGTAAWVQAQRLRHGDRHRDRRRDRAPRPQATP